MNTPRSVPITLPELVVAARFSLWHVRPGDRVDEGDRVAEVLLPGATVDVAAPATGTMGEAVVGPNEGVAAGAVLGWMFAIE